jgi:ABC-type cobalamin/Fe3+-siderophores transport system ATPase subunit
MRLTRLSLERFKAFDRFSLTLGSDAFLVGPNNAGKSTLIAAVRASAGMLNHARRLKPTLYERHRNLPIRAHRLNAETLGLVEENLRHQFRADETTVSMTVDSGATVTSVWPPVSADDGAYERSAFFYLRNKDSDPIVQPSKVRELTEPIGVIPALSPINRRERRLDDEYVRSQYEGRRTSQHTRNHLLQIDLADEFDEFTQFALEWLPELAELRVDARPGEAVGETELDVFVREQGDRTLKELFWSGDGMQVFVQLLAHLWRLRDASVIVLDEPDLYLHADLQRRLVRLLESLPAQTVTATHSPEMLAEAPADAVIWVDKSRRRGVRRPNPSTLEDLAAQIGSGFNLRLASALRARSVLFVEGDDMSLLRRVATNLDCEAVAAERACAVIGMQGFSHWVHVEPFSWLLRDFLEGAVEVFVVLDRDFRTDDEIRSIEKQLVVSGVRPHIWRRKELESYLLEIPTISRATGLPEDEVRALLSEVTSKMTGPVRARLLAELIDPGRKSSDSEVSRIEAGLDLIDGWSSDPEWRLRRYPAKEILSALNRELEAQASVTVSRARLARTMRPDEIAPEMADFLRDVESSLSSSRA